jgi:hypothetical protein
MLHSRAQEGRADEFFLVLHGVLLPPPRCTKRVSPSPATKIGLPLTYQPVEERAQPEVVPGGGCSESVASLFSAPITNAVAAGSGEPGGHMGVIYAHYSY